MKILIYPPDEEIGAITINPDMIIAQDNEIQSELRHIYHNIAYGLAGKYLDGSRRILSPHYFIILPFYCISLIRVKQDKPIRLDAKRAVRRTCPYYI